MANILRFVKNWRVELVLAAMVLSLGTTIRAQFIAAEWCSEVPVMSYSPAANLCLGDPSDCYMCVVWLLLAE